MCQIYENMSDILESINKLSKAERVVLESYAVNCTSNYYQPDNDVMAFINIDSRQLRRIESDLTAKRLLEKRYHYQKGISPSICIHVIVNMLENHPDEEDFFVNQPAGHFRPGSSTGVDFIKAMRFVIGIDKSQKMKSLPSYFLSFVPFVTKEKFFPKLMLFFSSEDCLETILEILTVRVILDAPCTPEELENITTTVGSDISLAADLEDIRMLYQYILSGKYDLSDSVSLKRPYQQILRGIRAANLGKYDEALGNFTLALKVLNKSQNLKNVFYSFFPSFYLIMTYARLGTSAAMLKLDQFLRKKDISTYFVQFIPLALAYAFTNKSHKLDVYQIKKALSLKVEYMPAVGLQYMGLMVSQYFGEMHDPALWNKLFTSPAALPRHKLICHEVSQYLDLDDSSREELISLYGSAPILTSLHRKTDWEWVIEEVLQQVGEEAEATLNPKTVKKERIIYLVSELRNEVLPMSQSWLKSERWSVPKNITMKKFMECEFPYADETDRQIADICRKKNFDSYYNRWPKISEAAQFLVDCDRVFMYSDIDCRRPVIFQKEDAYLKFNTDSNHSISVDSNVELGNGIPDAGETQVVKDERGDFRVINVNARQAAVINRLLDLKSFPISAQEQVKTMLTKLEQVIEVRSPLLDSKSIPVIKGATTVCARIRPAASMTYVVNFLVHPAPGGLEYCIPGEGKGVIYDMIDGNTVRVKRNISAEISAFNKLMEEMPFVDEDNSDNGFTFSLNVDQVLDLIEYAKDSSGNLFIEWEEGKALSVRRANPSLWNVGLKSKNEWFEIEGEVRIDEKTLISMTELLDMISRSRGRYVRLNDTDYLEIGGKLRRQLERLDALAVKSRNHTMISSFNAALLDDKALDGELKVTFDDRLVKLREKIVKSYDIEPKVPSALNAQLRPYQLEGFQWMVRLASWGAGACLADDMGLGKTVQTIAFLLLKASEGPALVVAPASVVPNWVGEMEKFAPSLKVSVLNKATDRAKLINEAGAYDVVLSTYGILNSEEETLAQKKWITVCLDEAHIIKNKDTKMSQAVMTLQAENRVMLTGTPIQNHLGELWNLFRFINPGLLGSDESFRRKFVVPIQDHDKDRQRALQRIIKPFMLRRTKSEVAEDLPEKTDIVMTVELSDSELAMYEAMRLKAAKIIGDADKVDVNTLAEITRLRRAACSMSLVEDTWKGPDSKIQAFLDLAEEFRSGSNRMLVFSQFTSFLSLVRDALDKSGIPSLYLDGSCSMKERERLVSEFRKGNIPLFLISLKAGGLGLNLPEANYVAHLDPWWNPAIEQQATDRAYRIGQKRNVTVYHFVAKNTIEEKIRRLHRSKRDLADSLLEGTDMATKLGIKEILELVNTK